MIQRTFFDAPEPPALARRSDPPTSHASATAIAPKLSARRQQCLEIIVARPGITGAEIEAINPQLRKRINELFKANLIRPCGERKSSVSGFNGIAWEVV